MLKVENLWKQFTSSPVLRGVRLTAQQGEILALLGLNGAGKSTLVKILAGALRPDHGQMWVDAGLYAPNSVSEAQDSGVSVVHQQRTLIPQLSVAQNIYLGDEPARLGLVKEQNLLLQAEALLGKLEIQLDPSVIVGDLGAGQQQLVDIVRAVKRDAKIIILDEPTAALTWNETEHLFEVLRRLRDQGMVLIFVSHRLTEVFELCDRVMVLREGLAALDASITELTEEQVVSRMVAGDDSSSVSAQNLYKAHLSDGSNAVADTDSYSEPLVELNPCSEESGGEAVIQVRDNEVVGLAGQVGSGCTSILEFIAGAHDDLDLDLRVRGRSVHWRSPSDAIADHVVLLPENRLVKGIAAELSVRANTSLPSLSSFTRFGWVNRGREKTRVGNVCERFSVVMDGLGSAMKSLSGGNQQKTVFARWVLAVEDAMHGHFAGTVFLLDEPMEGVDVKSRPELGAAIRSFADRGAGVFMASTDNDELLALCDRIYVMARGELIGEFATVDLTRERLSTLTMAA